MTPPTGPLPLEKGLRADAVGPVSSVALGIASAAPAYSMAATLGALAATVGERSPLVLLLGFVPMLLMAVAFRELNGIEPDCGTSFAWAARAFGPSVGFLAGWATVVPCVLVMANLAQVGAEYLFLLVGADGVAGSGWAQAAVGLALIAVLTAACYRGIRVTARLQVVLLSGELLILAALAVAALVRVYGGDAPVGSARPSAGWFGAGPLGTSTLVSGVLLAVFLYWGWDAAVSVNEETRRPRRTPGRSAVLATLVLVGTYLAVSTAATAFAGPARLAGTPDALAAVGDAVFGSTGGRLLVLAVLVSALASTQTTILPTARTTLAMAAYGAAPRALARIHPRHRTPTVSTVGMGIVSAAVYLLLLAVSQDALVDAVAATALAIAFYYAVTGLACPWYFRRELAGARNLLMRAVLPGVGGLAMAFAFVRSCWDLAQPENARSELFGLGAPLVVGVGSLLLGVALLVAWRIVAPGYFAGRLAGPGDLTGADGLARVPGDEPA